MHHPHSFTYRHINIHAPRHTTIKWMNASDEKGNHESSQRKMTHCIQHTGEQHKNDYNLLLIFIF